ncbi:MAG: polysaccharide deacetylase family protein [Chitinophagaceae bacterium]|nr:polysaccharide deacetylase family protein [Chitinophagaceae bacterium]
MILVYAHTTSPRLQYICNFVFGELMGTKFEITIDSEAFKAHPGVRVNYSDRMIGTDCLWIRNHSLLFEEVIIPQQVNCFRHNDQPAFFRSNPGSYPFDVLAASFYLVSRYEEYLPHQKDYYGRYAHENSLAHTEGFLKIPLVNHWINHLAEAIHTIFPAFIPRFPAFSFLPTYDIDIAYSYQHKGWLRNIGGFLRSPSLDRIRVLAGMEKDPFDAYDWMDELHEQNGLHPLYFFLVSARNGTYDKNILPHKEAMWKLVRRHASKYAIGLHPSWQSGDHPSLLKKEKEQLEAMAQAGQATQSGQTGLSLSRQHYIRFSLPRTFQHLLAAGITDDYSMGYGSINGFRASVASSFYWYDLEKEEQTCLHLHPFCFMEANSFYEQKQYANETYDEMNHYLKACKQINGTLITIWHNNFLGSGKDTQEWKDMYSRFIAQVLQ